MATRAPRSSSTGWCHLVVVLLVAVAVFYPHAGLGQEIDVTDPVEPGKKLEDTVVKDMLRIVDHKFDTLTTRITSLERAVSNLQFFSIRQFRQISGILQTTENDLESVGKQVGQLMVDGRSMKIAMSLQGRDLMEIKKTTTDVLAELESSVVYINDNVDKQGQFLKTVVEDSAIRSSLETTTQMSSRLDEIERNTRAPEKPPESKNCTVDFSPLTEHVDLRFAEFKLQTHDHFVNMINAAKLSPYRRRQVYDSSEERDENDKSDSRIREDENEVEETLKDSSAESEETEEREEKTSAYSLSSHSAEDKDNTTTDTNHAHSGPAYMDQKYQDENDERIMNALYNMTEGVLQAVSYFKNTGRIMEEILSNTDIMMRSQIDLNNRLGIVQMGNLPAREDHDGEASNVIPGSEGQGEGHNGYNPVVPGLGGCALSSDVVGNIATIIKNGSQLLEVLTDLAQMSSVSLTKATDDLQDQVTRVEGIRTQMATALLARTNGDASDPVIQLTNTTQRTFKLMEAVASNTGWLPSIFHNVEHVQSLANRSLHVVTRNHALLRQSLQANSAQKADKEEKPDDPEPTISNRIPRIPSQVNRSAQSDHDGESKDEAMLDRNSLETIYSTSLQLNRIMPALTKLLAEPDPLITLVEGGRPDQGRVEIYHKGQWGALCHSELSHLEADVICRHLGFRGGISAGAGHFGPGGGMTWTFNASCLATARCPVVEYSETSAPCSHERDAAVICDHMLRIIASDGSMTQKLGRLEIHHHGMWLPVCGEGWSGYSARVACQQMGFADGREMEMGTWHEGKNSTWLGKVACSGIETRLDACHTDGWTDTCPGLAPAGVRCL